MPFLSPVLSLWLAFSAAAAVVRPALAPNSLPTAAIPTERAAFELQADADRLYGALSDVHARALAGVPPTDLEVSKRALIGDMREVLGQVPPSPAEWSALSETLKDLRAERDALDRRPPTAANASSDAPRRAELNARIYALQMAAAWDLLKGQAPLAGAAPRRNAALWSLVGAYNSAAASRAEAGWLEGVLRADDLFGDGQTVLVRRGWRNLHADLETAARDARQGRADAARARLVSLAAAVERAPRPDSATLERHRRAADDLRAAATAAEGGQDGAALSRAILAVKALLPHPKVADLVAVAYRDASTAVRSQIHALASIKEQYLEVLAREASLRRWELVLAGRRISSADRALAATHLSDIRIWTERGFVGSKQLAAQNLAAALSALEHSTPTAARFVGLARVELHARRAELERISAAVLRRLARRLDSERP